jgi:ribosomal protein S27AE
MSCAGAHQRDGMDADDRGLTMERMCIACGGSGLAEHLDRTLPPPPCRLCHPNEAAVHMALAREMRTVATARRRDAFQMLRAAIMRGDILPRQRHSPSDGHVESPVSRARSALKPSDTGPSPALSELSGLSQHPLKAFSWSSHAPALQWTVDGPRTMWTEIRQTTG